MDGSLAGNRLIVALDVPGKDEALRIVDELEGIVSFYKVGLELLMGGALEDLLRRLSPGKGVFVDLKLPDDITETVRRVVSLSARYGVRFLTLSAQVETTTIEAALRGRGDSPYPKILFPSYLSSRDQTDYARDHRGSQESFDAHVAGRVARALAAGCDGVIASGETIGLVRRRHRDAIIVSPGVRPAGSSPDDHKRYTTPAEAIALGADYLVVGRPIRNAPDKRRAAREIIDEIDEALRTRGAGAASPRREVTGLPHGARGAARPPA